ncbi:MAG: OmpA family protein [Bdellovibrionota bacterium]
MFKRIILSISLVIIALTFSLPASAQDSLPRDNGMSDYHTWPRYRESESHPLRILGYALHPIGWVAREAIFRPLSYFASSTETTRSVMGFREPFDYREPECFNADDSTPDCRTLAPFDYGLSQSPDPADGSIGTLGTEPSGQLVRQVYFPDVNFDFDDRKLTPLGKGKVRQLAAVLQNTPGLHVVLEGHTDQIGTEAYNEKLGLDRAEAVKGELLAQGLSNERLSSVTFGKSKPVFAETDDWARAVNRRVEVHVDSE